MTTVEVVAADKVGERFAVLVTGDDRSTTEHEVTVSAEDWERFGRGYASGRDLVEASFAFLLERETKESILLSFELGVIARYFPEYPDAIAR